MRGLSDLKSDDEAVSSIIGEILMTGIAVLAFAVIAVSSFSMLDPVEEPHIDVGGWPNPYSDKIHIRHEGGELLDTDNLKLIVNVNGTKKAYTSSEIKNKFYSKDTWGLSDTISVSISEEFGQQVTSDKDIEFTLVHTKSSTVIENGILTSSKVGTGDGFDDGDDGGDDNGDGNGNGDGTGTASDRVGYVEDSVYRSGGNDHTLGFNFSVTEGKVTIEDVQLYLVGDDGYYGYNHVIFEGEEIEEDDFIDENVTVPDGINEFSIQAAQSIGGEDTDDISVGFNFSDGSYKIFDELQ